LRSAADVRGYHVQGSDNIVRHVDDFIIDDETWAVRYLAIDTSNWWFGKKVLVAPQWADRISLDERTVYLAMSRHVIKNGPEWDATAAITRAHEDDCMPIIDGRCTGAAPTIRTPRRWRITPRLTAYGLRVERKGKGLVLRDGAREIKVSCPAREVSAAHGHELVDHVRAE
jgi:hypothetical protein